MAVVSLMYSFVVSTNSWYITLKDKKCTLENFGEASDNGKRAVLWKVDESIKIHTICILCAPGKLARSVSLLAKASSLSED